jgi:hypothetical protein
MIGNLLKKAKCYKFQLFGACSFIHKMCKHAAWNPDSYGDGEVVWSPFIQRLPLLLVLSFSVYLRLRNTCIGPSRHAAMVACLGKDMLMIYFMTAVLKPSIIL